MLWMYQRVIFGEVTHEANRGLRDLTPREWAVLVPVIVFIVWIGVYPAAFTGEAGGERRGAHRPGPGQGEPALAMSGAAFPVVSLGPLLPTLIVLAAAGLVLLADLLPRRGGRDLLATLGLVGVVGALLATLWRWGSPGRAFDGMVVLDGFALFANVVICYAVALIILLSLDYLRRVGAESGEYYALVLFATAGMMLLAAAGDPIGVFLALEPMSPCP